MIKEQQRIKLAEMRGWKEIRAEVDWLPKELTGIYTFPHPTDPDKIKYYISRKPIPDYPNDLNAINEFESWLESNHPHRASEYPEVLNRVILERAGIKVGPNSMPAGKFRLINAKADVKLEALVKTLNLWTE